MKTLRARLDNIEESLRGIPGGMDPGIDALAAIIKAQPDLAHMIEFALGGFGASEVPAYVRADITPTHAQRLLDAVAEVEDRARRQECPPSPCLRTVVQNAQAFIDESHLARPPALEGVSLQRAGEAAR